MEIGTKVRILDEKYTSHPAGAVGTVIEPGPFTGMFGVKDEFTVSFPDDVDDEHWYFDPRDEGKGWERA